MALCISSCGKKNDNNAVAQVHACTTYQEQYALQYYTNICIYQSYYNSYEQQKYVYEQCRINTANSVCPLVNVNTVNCAPQNYGQPAQYGQSYCGR